MGVTKTQYGTWIARWTDPYGKQASKTWKTKADADAYYKRMTSDVARGSYVDPRLGRITLERWADEWLQGARNLSRGGHDTYRRDLDRHILPVLGKVPVGRLGAQDIDRYLTDGADKLAPSTVHRHYRTLHRMLEVARKRGLIARNPCEHVQPPTVPRTKGVALTVDQVDDLADAMTRPEKWDRRAPVESRWRAWVFVVVYGELRWSESVGLRRRHVDGPRLHIVEQLIHRGRGDWDRPEPKASSARTVTLPPFVVDELRSHLEQFSLPGPDGLVFPTRRGTPPQAPSFTGNTFKRALQRAGLPPMKIHDLRRTGISLAIASGADVKQSQARAGHASSRIHLDTYARAFPAGDEAIAAGLENLRAESRRRRLRAV